MFRKISFKKQKKSRVVPVIISENSYKHILPGKTNNTKYKLNYNNNCNDTCLNIENTFLNIEKEISL